MQGSVRVPSVQGDRKGRPYHDTNNLGILVGAGLAPALGEKPRAGAVCSVQGDRKGRPYHTTESLTRVSWWGLGRAG